MKKLILLLSMASSYAQGELNQEVQLLDMPPEMNANTQKGTFAQTQFQENKVTLLANLGASWTQPITYSERSYSLMPASVSANWVIDNVSNDDLANGWLRGCTSLTLSPYYYKVLHGPESRFTGLIMGPSYNFVQKDSDWVPFVGTQLGIGFCDSGRENHLPYQQGQDFVFTFQVHAGVRYCLSPHTSLVAEISYQHFSNGGLSEPKYINHGLDILGPSISFGYAF